MIYGCLGVAAYLRIPVPPEPSSEGMICGTDCCRVHGVGDVLIRIQFDFLQGHTKQHVRMGKLRRIQGRAKIVGNISFLRAAATLAIEIGEQEHKLTGAQFTSLDIHRAGLCHPFRTFQGGR
ncbi:MAG: hypothetical protein ACJARU_001993, partial [Congregibacter sp.]